MHLNPRSSISLSLLIIGAMSTQSQVAHADAVLSTPSARLFPDTVELDVQIRAQVEVSTYLFHFDAIETNADYVLTVPGPDGAYVIGVDMDRGEGFVETAMVGEAPPPSLGGSDAAQQPEVAAWLGTDPLRADFADLAPGPMTVRVRFQRLLRRHNGAVEFGVGIQRSPLRAASDPGPAFTGVVQLATSRSLVDLDVSGAASDVQQQSAGAQVYWQGQGDGDARIELRYREASADIDVQFLTHRTPSADPLGGTEGYFMLIMDADSASEASAQARTLSMVIDESGSMLGGKIEQAKEAARAMLDHLGSQDEFNIITFNEGASSFRNSPVTASTSNIELARDYIKGINADGGTNLDEGIQTGLLGLGPDPFERFDAIILLSDGLATTGETNPGTIHDHALLSNTAKARMFTFSVGSGADRTLMEALARSNRGRHFDLNDAQATAEMLLRVNELFEDVRVVRLTDLQVQAQNIETSQVLPEQMQDLFSGGQAIIVGRYGGASSGTSSVRITGNDNGAGFLRSISVSAPAQNTDNAFIKHLWATEKVGSLLAQMSTGGDLASLTEEITELGLAYRIQTPFTSFSAPPDGGGGGGSGSGSGGWSGGGVQGRSSGPRSALLPLLMLAGAVLLLLRPRRT